MRKTIVLLFLAAIAGLPSAAGATILQVQGGPGGGYFKTDCPHGQYVVGFFVRAGAWIDAVAPICAPYDASRKAFGARTVRDLRGGRGGAPQEKYCPSGAVIGVEFGWTREGDQPKYVDDIGFYCQGSKAEVCIETGEGCGSVHNTPSGPGMGSLFMPFDSACPAGEVVTGIHGRSGESLDALGLICGPEPHVVNMGKAKPPSGGQPTGQQPGSKIQGGGRMTSEATRPPVVQPQGSSKPQGPTQPPSYALSCHGGGKMHAQATTDGFVRITFTPASKGSAAVAPHKGECAWPDRGFRPGEPEMLVYNGADKDNLVKAAKKGHSFRIHAYNNNQGAMVITSIDSISN